MDAKKRKIDLTDLKTVIFLAGVCCLLWGSATPSIKIGYSLFSIDSSDTASIIVFAGIRFIIAGLLVILFHSITLGRPAWPEKGSAPAIVLISLAQTSFQYFFFYVGLAHASGVHGAILVGTNSFFLILVSALVFRYEALSVRKVLGCLAAFAGICIVNFSGISETGTGISFFGEGFMLICCIFYGLSGCLFKLFSRQRDAVTLSGWQFTLGGVTLTLCGFLMGGSLKTPVGPAGYPLLIYLAFISAVAYTLWGVLLKYNTVSRVAICGCMNPIFGVILSAVLLGEADQALSIGTPIALALVCLGICIINLGTDEGKAAEVKQRRKK